MHDHVTHVLGLPDPVGVAVNPVTDTVYAVSTYAPSTAKVNNESVDGVLYVINGHTDEVTAKDPIAGAVAIQLLA